MSAPWEPQMAGGLQTVGQNSILNYKQLTSAIKNATSADRLLQLAYTHQRHMNNIHVAAIFTKLANITKAQPHQQGQPHPAHSSSPQAREALVQQLQDLLLSQRCEGHCPRGLANIVWALGKMQNAPSPELVIMLLRRFFSQLAAAVPQDIANVLWGVAQVTRDHGLICPPGCKERVAADDAAAEAAAAATGGHSSASSSCSITGESSLLEPLASALPEAAAAPAAEGAGEACREACGSPSSTPAAVVARAVPVPAPASAGLQPQQQQEHQQAASDGSSNRSMEPLLTVQQVQQLLQQLCDMLLQAAPQTISNITCAICVLQHCHKWCMCSCLPQVQQLVGAFVNNINESLPSHIHKVVKCLTQLSLACAGHAKERWLSWQPPLLQAMLSHMVMQRRTLKQLHVVSILRDTTQIGCLFMPSEVTTELAAVSAAAAERAAAAAAATRTSAVQHSAEHRETDQDVLLAVAAAVAAIEEVLAPNCGDEVDDDSGLPALSLPLAAAAAAARRAALHCSSNSSSSSGGNAAGRPGAAFGGALPSVAESGGQHAFLRGGSSAAEGSIEAGGTPVSPDTAYVQSVVLGMFQRLGTSDTTPAAPEAPTPAGTASGGRIALSPAGSSGLAASAGDAGGASSRGVGGILAVQAAPGTPTQTTSTAAAPAGYCGSSGGGSRSVLDKLLPQLAQLGLLQQYNTLRCFCNAQDGPGLGLLTNATYPGAFGSAVRPGQPGGPGYLGSSGRTDQPPHLRQHMSWQQQLMLPQGGLQCRQQQQQQQQPPPQQAPLQRWWDANRQQQQQQQPGPYRVGSPAIGRSAGSMAAADAGVFGTAAAQQRLQGPNRQVFPDQSPPQQQHQQQQQGYGGTTPPPPPPLHAHSQQHPHPQQHQQRQQQHHSVLFAGDGSLGDLHACEGLLKPQDSMTSPFQCSAVAAAAAGAPSGLPPGIVGSPHGSSGSSNGVMLPHMPVLSSRASTSSSGFTQMIGSSSIASVPSVQSGIVSSANFDSRASHGSTTTLTPANSSGDRMRARLPGQISGPLSGQGSTLTPHSSCQFPTSPGSGHLGTHQGSGSSGSTRGTTMQQQHVPLQFSGTSSLGQGALRGQLEGMGSYRQHQHQHLHGGGSSGSGGVAGGPAAGQGGQPGIRAMFSEAMTALSPEASVHSVHSARSADEPPGLLSSSSSMPFGARVSVLPPPPSQQQQQQQLEQQQQRQQEVQHAVAHMQQQQHAVARSTASGLLVLEQDGQQMTYQRMPDGTLVPVQQPQQQQSSAAAAAAAASTGFAASMGLSVMPSAQQQQQQNLQLQQQQQQAQALQLLQQQQVQQQQQQLLMVQTSVGTGPSGMTAFDATAGNAAAVAAALAAAQQQQQQQLNRQQALQQELLQLQQLQQQQQQLDNSQVLLYLSGSGGVADGAGTGSVGSNMGLSTGPVAAGAGYMLTPSATAAQLQMMVQNGGALSAAMTPPAPEGSASFDLLNQGQIMLPQHQQQQLLQQQQQLLQQQQHMLQQQQLVGGLDAAGAAASLLQLGGGGTALDAGAAQQLLLQQQAARQQQHQQQPVYYVLPPGGL